MKIIYNGANSVNVFSFYYLTNTLHIKAIIISVNSEINGYIIARIMMKVISEMFR